MWKDAALGSSRAKGGVWRNFRPIPNVRSFRLKSKVWDDVCLKFGIFKGFDPGAEFLNYRNKDINRYVEHQLRRLQRADTPTY